MKIHRVKRARRDHGPCNVCGKEIEKGDSYKWFKHAFRAKTKVCEVCFIKPSMMARSDKIARLLRLQEDFYEHSGETIADIAEVLQAAIDEAEQVAEEYEESAERVAEYFENSPTQEEIEEKAQLVLEWSELLRAACHEIVGSDDLEEARQVADEAMMELPL